MSEGGKKKLPPDLAYRLYLLMNLRYGIGPTQTPGQIEAHRILTARIARENHYYEHGFPKDPKKDWEQEIDR